MQPVSLADDASNRSWTAGSRSGSIEKIDSVGAARGRGSLNVRRATQARELANLSGV
jgi:hypothetical protein